MTKTKRNLPSKYEIAKHWRNKDIDGYEPIIDFGEPSCWACRNYIYYEEEAKLTNAGMLEEVWNASENELERCHIVPRALGGSDDVDNLFLMCGYCHKASPDTTDKEYFFKWVKNRKWQDTLAETPMWKAREMVVQNGYDTKDYLNYLKKLHNEEIEFTLDEDINTHGFELVESTIVYAYYKGFENYILNK